MKTSICSTGDVILVYGDMDDDGFFFGECMASGRQGLVPSNFLQEVPSRSPSPYHQGAPLLQSSDEARPPGNSREQGRRPKTATRADSSTSASSVSGPGMTSHYGASHVSSRKFVDHVWNLKLFWFAICESWLMMVDMFLMFVLTCMGKA